MVSIKKYINEEVFLQLFMKGICNAELIIAKAITICIKIA